MKAEIYVFRKIDLEDGSVNSTIIWKLPTLTRERPHGYKYRLNYHTAAGRTLVRYDNSHGKGDHKHILDKIFPYKFVSVEKLLIDFEHDVIKIQEGKNEE